MLGAPRSRSGRTSHNNRRTLRGSNTVVRLSDCVGGGTAGPVREADFDGLSGRAEHLPEELGDQHLVSARVPTP
eukprot:12885705-Prorocentrum_lima.AAC.1